MANKKTNDPFIGRRIIELTEKVGPDKTICPSEVARDLWPDDWRSHMEVVREVALSLQLEGEIEICQRGQPIQSQLMVGPIRLRRKRRI